MPPAFNLSQDQTLQFDLEFTQRNRTKTICIASFSFRERLKSEGPLQVALQHHFTSNAHAYRLWILKEHRKLLSVNSSSASLITFYRYQQRSEILICFLRRRQVFLKIYFRDTRPLVFFATFDQFAFAICRQQQRGEILICFRKLVKHFLKISSRKFSSTRQASPARLEPFGSPRQPHRR